jgi:hypothetical protein
VTYKRTIGEQVASGFRIAGSILLVFAFFIALTWATMFSLGRSSNLTSNPHRTLGSVAPVGLSAVLFFTTRYWAKWVPGIVCYCLARTFFGATLFVLSGKINVAKELVFIAIYSAIALLLTWRHFERDPKGIEKFGLVAFVICAPVAIALQSYVPLLAGLALLGIGESAQRIMRPQTEPCRGPRKLGDAYCLN